MQQTQSNIWQGALLVAGTSIGGGMLALPVLTSQAGFIPSFVLYIICWFFMASTGLLFLEVSQWMKKEANILSMAEYTLGVPGRLFAWILYMFLFYCLTVAYMVGCGNILVEFLHHKIPDWSGPIFFTLLFTPFLICSTQAVSRVNVVLIAGLAISYFGFVLVGFPYVDSSLLYFRHWSESLNVLPIAFTSFAYQGIIPTLATHMNYDIPRIRKAILLGSFIPLIAYILWEWLILGIIPVSGPDGLHEALAQGWNAVQPLRTFISNPVVYGLGEAFALFALVTSFIGVSLGLRDFLADGLQLTKTKEHIFYLISLVLVPPLLISVLYPHIFLYALDYAGGFGCALLLGLLPIVMTWIGRYHLHRPEKQQLFGGRFLLIILGSFVVIELISEFIQVIEKIATYLA